MAQDFEGSGAQITNSATTLLTANSDDAVVGIRLANVLTSAVTVSVFIDDNGSGTLRYIVKDLALPASSSVELVQGGSKIVLNMAETHPQSIPISSQNRPAKSESRWKHCRFEHLKGAWILLACTEGFSSKFYCPC